VGVCPGNHESAGKRLSGTARKGNVWLRRRLCQDAWAAAHATDTSWAARFRRLAARKGKKRAIVAVAHTIVVMVSHLLKTHQSYRELGADYLDRLNADYLKRSLLKRLQRLGVQLTVHSVDHPATLTG
jgi:transposase